MSKTVITALIALALSAAPAFAGPPTAEQKAEFYKTCMGIAKNDTLCSCKADAAMTLIDEDFMKIVIAGMKGKAPTNEEFVPYGRYITASNRACGLNY